MKLEKLQAVWQTHHQQAAVSQSSALATEMMAKSAKFENTLWRRDWIETCAAIFVIVMFGSSFFTDQLGVISKLGVLTIIASTLWIVWILHSNRKRQATIPADHSLLECARVELQRVEAQIRLLRSISLWYTTPLTTGAIVFVFGLFEPWWVGLIAAGGFLVIFVLAGWVIHRMNQHGVKQSLVPLQRELQELIESLESPPENGSESTSSCEVQRD
ncbi:MAG: hypothetical protein U1A77_18950 [Pirellulales bacterium]